MKETRDKEETLNTYKICTKNVYSTTKKEKQGIAKHYIEWFVL